jgi:hypothetical protein
VGPRRPVIERRRSPRTEIHSDEVVRLELRHPVQLLEISQSGALLGCEARLPVGARALIRTDLAALPFTAEVVVKRYHVKTGPTQTVALGTQFGSMDDRSRQHLERFLQRGKG